MKNSARTSYVYRRHAVTSATIAISCRYRASRDLVCRLHMQLSLLY